MSETYFQIIPVHRRDEFQADRVAALLDQTNDLLVRCPLDVLITDVHDKVAFLHSTQLKGGNTLVNMSPK